jgi:hypothetical protein
VKRGYQRSFVPSWRSCPLGSPGDRCGRTQRDRRPHRYHSCRYAPEGGGAQVNQPGLTVADRDKPEASGSEWHGDGTVDGSHQGARWDANSAEHRRLLRSQRL